MEKRPDGSDDYDQPLRVTRRGVVGGCAVGAVGALCVLFLAFLIGLSSLPGPDFPATPVQTVAVPSSISATTTLDAANPVAVQPFSVDVTNGGQTTVQVRASSSSASMRVTVLANDDGPLQLAWSSYSNPGMVALTFPVAGPGESASRRYLALVELVDPVSLSTRVDLTIAGLTVFADQGYRVDRTRPGSLATPSDFEFQVTATEPFEPRSVTVLHASYRETLPAVRENVWSTRTLRLQVQGAARPVSSGGRGNLIAIVWPVSLEMAPAEQILVTGYLEPGSQSMEWRYNPYNAQWWSKDLTSGEELIGRSPATQCDTTGRLCTADIVLSLQAYASPDYGTAETPLSQEQPESVTFEVEVTDYLLDMKSASTRDRLTVDLVAGPQPSVFVPER